MPPAADEDEPQPARHAALSAWANWLIDEQIPPDQDLTAALRFACRAVPHAEHAALTRIRRGSAPEVLATTSDVGPHLAELQAEAAAGPCAEAVASGRLRHVDDVAAETRWPRLAELVLTRTPVRSMVAFPVQFGSRATGTFTVYAMTGGAFDDVDLAVGALLASYLAAVTHAAARHEQIVHLETALESSRRIGAAMGIVMFRERVTFEQAFDRLRSASQRLHRKLRDVAADVVDTGQVPG